MYERIRRPNKVSQPMAIPISFFGASGEAARRVFAVASLLAALSEPTHIAVQQHSNQTKP